RCSVDTESLICLRDNLLLAEDMRKSREAYTDAMLGSTATLAATAVEAEELALAQSLGDLRLLLRTQLDGSLQNYKPVTLGNIGQRRHDNDPTKPDGQDTTPTDPSNPGLTLPPALKPPTPPTTDPTTVAVKPPVTHTMKIINAGEVTKAVFVWDAVNGCWVGAEPTKKPEEDPKPADPGKPETAPK